MTYFSVQSDPLIMPQATTINLNKAKHTDKSYVFPQVISVLISLQILL